MTNRLPRDYTRFVPPVSATVRVKRSKYSASLPMLPGVADAFAAEIASLIPGTEPGK